MGALAPWCLGTGLLVSFTASAGIDGSSGASIAEARSLPAPAPSPGDIMPESGLKPVNVFNFSASPVTRLISPAALTLSSEHELRSRTE